MIIFLLLSVFIILFLSMGVLGILAENPALMVMVLGSLTLLLLYRGYIQEKRREEVRQAILDHQSARRAERSALMINNCIIKLTRTRAGTEIQVPVLKLHYKKGI